MSVLSPPSGRGKPEAVIIQFPLQRRLAIRIVRAADSPEWLVLTHDREHGWTHGSFDAALRDAHFIASSYGVAVRSTAAGGAA